MQIIRVGVDISKSVFQVHGVDGRDKPVWRAKLKRSSWLGVLSAKLEPGCEVGLEACSGAHHWARELQTRGYRPRLIAPQFVKPYVKSNKTDRNDAEAICEAMARPSMRFVSVKSVEQQDLQALHRVRSTLVGQRTAKANQIRGLVAEYGLVAPVGVAPLRQAIPLWLEDGENGLSAMFRQLLNDLWADLRELDERVWALDKQIELIARGHPVARRLLKLRGVGPLTATAMVSALGNGTDFRRGRDFAVWVGLTPRMHGTGGKDRLLGISKRGDAYLRKLLVHGARSVIRHAVDLDDPLSAWIKRLLSRKHVNVVTVALANKTARLAWALVRHGEEYRPELAVTAAA